MQILTAALTPEHRAKGLTIREDSEGNIFLVHEDKVLTEWKKEDGDPTVSKIWAAADAYIENIADKDICEVCGAEKKAYREMMHEECFYGH